jgi:vitamin B12 transporter
LRYERSGKYLIWFSAAAGVINITLKAGKKAIGEAYMNIGTQTTDRTNYRPEDYNQGLC